MKFSGVAGPGSSFSPFVFLLSGAVFLLIGCSSYQTKIKDAYAAMEDGHPDKAAEKLKEPAYNTSDDQLVYILEYGVAQQLAHNYEESVRAFLMADKLADIQDYTSLSRQAGSLLLSESMVQYKGDDYEKLLINVYLAIDYTLMGKYEDAMVEVRRLNLRLQKYRLDAKRDYDQNPFARYLSAMIYESNQQWDDSYLDYAETLRLDPGVSQVRQDVLYTAKKSRRLDDYEGYKKQFPDVKMDPERGNPAYGQVVLIYQQGQGPQKRPNPSFTKIPKLYPRFSRGQSAILTVDAANAVGGKTAGLATAAGTVSQRTAQILSIQDLAMKTLNDLYAGMIAKRLAGVATKAVVADQVRQKAGILGDLLYIGLNAADQADLRQWSSLPQSFQVARVWVRPGLHTIHVHSLDGGGQSTGEAMPDQQIKVDANKTVFVNWRSFR